MICSRLFVCWAIAVCLAACLCVSTETEQAKAEKAVEDLQELTEEAVRNAKRLDKDANSVRSRVWSNKQSAENAISQVGIVPNDNKKAAEIADKVKETSAKIIAMYPNASKAAENAVKVMKVIVTKADALDEEACIDTELNSDPPTNYTQINESIEEVKAKVETFKTEMKDKKKILESAGNLEINMSNLVETVKVGKYQFSVLLSVTQINTVLETAKSDVIITEKKRDEVNETLKTMRELSINASDISPPYVDAMLRNTENYLFSASKAVKEATTATEEIMKIKTKADASLDKFTVAKKSESVVSEVGIAKQYVKEVMEKAPEIQKAVQSAEIAAKSAESAKQSFLQVLSSGKTQPSIEDNKITNEPSEPVKDGEEIQANKESVPSAPTNTESNTQALGQTISKSNTQQHNKDKKVTENPDKQLYDATEDPQNSSKVNKTLINSEQKVIETAENSMNQESDKHTIKNKREQLNGDISKTQKGKISRGAHNITTISFVGQDLPSFGALNDGSITLSLPLLAALIASVVLQ